MASVATQLSKIDTKTKLCIYGWIRCQENALKISYIPPIISTMVILYFGGNEVFDIINDDIKLLNDGTCIEKIKLDGDWNNNSYGIAEISSLSGYQYQWDLKIKCKYKNVLFGISSTVTPNKEFEQHEGHHYVMSAGGSVFDLDDAIQWRFYCGEITGNDNVTIHLDLKQATLKFIINGSDKGIAYNDIQKSENIKYRLLVTIRDIGDTVTISNFSQK